MTKHTGQSYDAIAGKKEFVSINFDERDLYSGLAALHWSTISETGSRWYSRNELLWMLQLAGFSDMVIKGDYTDDDFGPHHTQTMVFIARKSSNE